jgi:hypothetical protein
MMFHKPPMPTSEELAAMTNEDLDKKLKQARAALQEANQLARDASEQEKVFSAFEAEQNRRFKNQIKREAGVDEIKKG